MSESLFTDSQMSRSFMASESKTPSVLGEDISDNFLKAFAVNCWLPWGGSTNIIICLVKDGSFSNLDELAL